MEINGRPGLQPVLSVVFDPEAQAVRVNFDPAEFKTWDFVLAVLGMAEDFAEGQRKFAQMAAMQQQAQDQAVARKILRH